MADLRKLIVTAWFNLTREERWLVSAILLLALLGLAARFIQLRIQPIPAPPPPGTWVAPTGGTP